MHISNNCLRMKPMHRSPVQTDFTAALKAADLKVTASRLGVLEALAAAPRPQTIKQIITTMKRSDQGKLFKVTIYRVLADLKEAGLVRQVDFQQPHAFFELADPADHHHLVCTACGRVEDFVGCEAGRLARKALAQSTQFTAVSGHSFELFGTCKSCQLG